MQELWPPLPFGPPSTSVGLPWWPPSWDSAAAEIIPYVHFTQALKSAESHTLHGTELISELFRPIPLQLWTQHPITESNHLHLGSPSSPSLVGATPSLELQLARYPVFNSPLFPTVANPAQ
ncbi:Hypothetical predicted protein [Marmota monax]|uniref:Uncharacterized protein n=1 Tax=Marmota monax TaxID=9995 RepID=A0A5E4BDD3_MARMO|nr:hypothetical protein GHT09_007462 [Marmota monax]VTJ67426.1 Hypothetical predicted protein [Marmota monax]